MSCNLRNLAAVVALVLAAAPLVADAQPPAKVHRIGYMSGASKASEVARIDAFRQGFWELGYVEGKNLAIEYRHADGKAEALPGYAAELVRLKVT